MSIIDDVPIDDPDDDPDDPFDKRLLNDPRFLARIAQSRKSAAEGRVTRLEDLPEDAR